MNRYLMLLAIATVIMMVSGCATTVRVVSATPVVTVDPNVDQTLEVTDPIYTYTDSATVVTIEDPYDYYYYEDNTVWHYDYYRPQQRVRVNLNLVPTGVRIHRHHIPDNFYLLNRPSRRHHDGGPHFGPQGNMPPPPPPPRGGRHDVNPSDRGRQGQHDPMNQPPPRGMREQPRGLQPLPPRGRDSGHSREMAPPPQQSPRGRDSRPSRGMEQPNGQRPPMMAPPSRGRASQPSRGMQQPKGPKPLVIAPVQPRRSSQPRNIAPPPRSQRPMVQPGPSNNRQGHSAPPPNIRSQSNRQSPPAFRPSPPSGGRGGHSAPPSGQQNRRGR